jgi:AAA domain
LRRKRLALKDLLVKDTKPKGVLISIEGQQKCGKTEFGLSMPGDLYVLNLNHGLVGVYEKHVEAGKTLYVQDIMIPYTEKLPGEAFTLLAGAAAEQWKRAILSLREAVKDPSISSIFIDTGSELWDLLRIARLGKLTQVMPIQYAAVNAEFRQLLQVLLTCGKNVVLSHKVKPEYVNDVKTNRFERSGFGDIGFDVQIELVAEKDTKKDGVDQFSISVVNCRPNKDLTGTVLRGADCNFSTLVRLAYPKLVEKDWI